MRTKIIHMLFLAVLSFKDHKTYQALLFRVRLKTWNLEDKKLVFLGTIWYKFWLSRKRKSNIEQTWVTNRGFDSVTTLEEKLDKPWSNVTRRTGDAHDLPFSWSDAHFAHTDSPRTETMEDVAARLLFFGPLSMSCFILLRLSISIRVAQFAFNTEWWRLKRVGPRRRLLWKKQRRVYLI